MLNRFTDIACRSWFLPLIYTLLALFISTKNYHAPLKDIPGFDRPVNAWNNYLIFANSPEHLQEGKNLYQQYPEQQYDVFKYSPTFSLLFTPLAALPHWLGLACWNLLNMLLFVYALSRLDLSPVKRLGFGLLTLPEAFTTTLNSQSNMLIAALLLLAWKALEDGGTWKPVLLIWLTVFIKLFGVLFFAMVLLYPQRWKAIVPGLVCGALLFLLPLPHTGWSRLLQHYAEYSQLLAGDHGTFVKYSVMGWLQAWFGLSPDKNMLVAAGLLIQLIPLLFFRQFARREFRTLYLASWLLWMVIFNHMAESATFIIAVTGVMVWYFFQEKREKWQIALLIPVIMFTCLGPSDLYPPALRKMLVEDWQLKVFPCILIWCTALIQLLKPASNVASSGKPA